MVALSHTSVFFFFKPPSHDSRVKAVFHSASVDLVVFVLVMKGSLVHGGRIGGDRFLDVFSLASPVQVVR